MTRHPHHRRRARAATWAAALWLLGAGAGRAHDLGTVQVYGTFLKGGGYRIDVVVDEEHLRAAQLGGPPHATRYGRIAGLGEPARGRLGRFLSDLADAAVLSFDGRAASPRVEIPVPEAGGPAQRPGRAVLRFSGEIPGGVRSFVWLNTLALGRYPVVLHNEGEEASIWKWVQGGSPSPAFALAADVVPPPPPPASRVAAQYLGRGFGDVLPRGSAAILFMLGLALLAFRVRPLLAEAATFAAADAGGLALAAHWAGAGGSGEAGAAAGGPTTILAVLVALTLVGVAAANLLECLAPRASRSAILLARLGLVMGCGVVQGVAAAGLLLAPGLPRERAGAAFAGYGLGVAAALAAVLAAAFFLFGASFRLQPWYRRRVAVPGSILLAAIGLFRALQMLM